MNFQARKIGSAYEIGGADEVLKASYVFRYALQSGAGWKQDGWSESEEFVGFDV